MIDCVYYGCVGMHELYMKSRLGFMLGIGNNYV